METKTMVVWVVGLIMLGVVLCTPAACTMNRQRLVADAINKGADPIAVKCALEGETSHSPACVLKASERKSDSAR